MKRWVLSLVSLALCLPLAGCAANRHTTSPETAEQADRERQTLGDEAWHRLHGARLPNRWFMDQRRSGDPIPPSARSRALARYRAARAGDGGATDDAPGVWVPAGPENIGGRVTALACDPNAADRIWLGAAAAGVWLSEDGGVNWIPVFDDEMPQPIGALAAHPTDSAVVYAGTGEDNGGGYSYDGEGVLKTTDGGQTWVNVGLAETRRIGQIAIDPVNPDRVFVAAGGNVFLPDQHRGVYRSTDGGQSWSRVLFVADDTGAIDVQIDPSDPNRIYAAMWTRQSTDTDVVFGGPDSGLWQSTDGGDTWSELTAGLPSSDLGRIGIAIAASDSATVYARYQNASGSYKGLWKTTDAGQSWFKVDTGPGIWRFFLASYGYYFGEVVVDPADPDHVFLLDVDWFESTNGGVSFQRLGGMHVDHHAMLIQPARWLMGNDGGFYRSTDDGGTWIHAVTLPISQAYDIGIDRLDPLRRFIGLQDNGTVRTVTGGISDWTNVHGGDGLQTEVDPTDSAYVYASSQGGAIVRSTDGGDTFLNGTNGIDGAERTNWNAPVTHDPQTHQKLYTGTIRVYRSADGAQNWTSISPNLTDGPLDAPAAPSGGGPLADFQSHLADVLRNTVTTIGVSPVDTEILWAGTDDGNVWVTDDGGAAWTRVDVPGRTEWVTRVTADPFEAQSAYVTFSGFRNGSRMPHIFRTTDLGASWTDIGGNLPEVPLNDVEPDPQWAGRLFAAGDLGTFVTDSYGQQWQPMNGGMPIVVVHDLTLHDPTRTLYAGTHAASLWTFDVEQLPIPDRDLDGSNNLEDCAPDDGGAFAGPGEVTGVVFAADKQTLSWDSAKPTAGADTLHDVARGRLGELPAGSGASESCLAGGTGDASVTDLEPPPVGDGFWYLVRASNVCAVGTWGQDSDGLTRSPAVCP